MTPYRCRVAPFVALLVLATDLATAQVTRWEVDGVTREGIVVAPTASNGETGAPLVLSFHGFGDHMHNFQHTDLHRAWPEAVVVYLQGLPTRRGLPGWQVEPGETNRDLRLVDVALASLRERFAIDDDRVYATGYSNGGMFTYLLWAERSRVFAAFAPVAARLRPSGATGAAGAGLPRGGGSGTRSCASRTSVPPSRLPLR